MKNNVLFLDDEWRRVYNVFYSEYTVYTIAIQLCYLLARYSLGNYKKGGQSNDHDESEDGDESGKEK